MQSNESFESRYRHVANKGVNRHLKRQLLKELGFPLDERFDDVTSRINPKGIEDFLRESGSSGMYLVTFLPDGERLRYGIPPFFEVLSAKVIFSRHGHGIRRVGAKDVVDIVKSLPKQSAIYRTSRIWGPHVYACRLMYVSAEEQKFEIERGTVPRLMGLDRSRSSSQFTLSRFKPNEAELQGIEPAVARIVSNLSSFSGAFEKLEKLGINPTIEFAYKEDQSIVVVDVDWASQWKIN